MRVLFCFGDGHWPRVKGGLQTATHDLCLALQQAGASPAVLCGLPADADGQPAPVHTPTEHDTSLGYPVFRSADPVRDLPLLAAAWEPTALVVQSGGRGFIDMTAAALTAGKPTAVYLHNVELASAGGWMAASPEVLVLANSAFTAQRWHALLGLHAHVVPPVVNAAACLAGLDAREKVLFVNPAPVKGVHLALALAGACPDIPFTFVHSWPLQSQWASQVAARVAALGNVVLLDAVDDMRPLYAQTRLLLMPSVWEEAFGRTVVEAQINGIPALASDRGALPQVVGAAGLVRSPHAPLADWVLALRTMYADPSPWQAAAKRQGLLHAAQTPLIAAELLGLLAAHASR
ncbi:MAG: glycosyltransferase [Burkholderiales bacterium]|nr:MAG: glycosyltransferase [Burkholderiales bacterium]